MTINLTSVLYKDMHEFPLNSSVPLSYKLLFNKNDQLRKIQFNFLTNSLVFEIQPLKRCEGKWGGRGGVEGSWYRWLDEPG